MIKGLIINATILISFLLIGSQFFREKEVDADSPYKIRILGGLFAGMVGSVLIFFSILIAPTFILDFRQIAIIFAACYGGWLSAIVAGVIIGLFRLVYMGINNVAIASAATALFIAAGCGLIALLHLKRRIKWTLMTANCLAVSVIVYSALIKDSALLLSVIMVYTIGLSVLSTLVYYYSEYFILSNRLMKQLKEEATKDFLTGLNNVRNFDKLYEETIEHVIRRKEQLSMLILDIDFFKKVNDIYGHQAGDAVLKEIGKLLNKSCREQDILSRNGGEEFTILLVDCSPQKAFETGERIRKEVEKHRFTLPEGNHINITVSIGVATLPDMAPDKENLFKLSDRALYMAKNSGRNRVCII